jgi:hypothetical protein
MEKQSLPGKSMTIFAGLFAREGVLLLADPNGVAFLENAKGQKFITASRWTWRC